MRCCRCRNAPTPSRVCTARRIGRRQRRCEQAGCSPKKASQAAGVYVGGWQEKQRQPVRYLRHDGPEHVLAFAPTRSGKGVGLVLPTLLS